MLQLKVPVSLSVKVSVPRGRVLGAVSEWRVMRQRGAQGRRLCVEVSYRPVSAALPAWLGLLQPLVSVRRRKYGQGPLDSCTSVSTGPHPLSDSVVRLGRISNTIRDLIGQLPLQLIQSYGLVL